MVSKSEAMPSIETAQEFAAEPAHSIGSGMADCNLATAYKSE